MSMNSEICVITQIICHSTNGIQHRYRLKCNSVRYIWCCHQTYKTLYRTPGFAKVSVFQAVIRFTLKSPEQISQMNLDWREISYCKCAKHCKKNKNIMGTGWLHRVGYRMIKYV